MTVQQNLYDCVACAKATQSLYVLLIQPYRSGIWPAGKRWRWCALTHALYFLCSLGRLLLWVLQSYFVTGHLSRGGTQMTGQKGSRLSADLAFTAECRRGHSLYYGLLVSSPSQALRLQMTPASSWWPQLCSPQPRWKHEDNSCSSPLQPTLSKRMGPEP